MKKISKETIEKLAKVVSKPILSDDNGEIVVKGRRLVFVETGDFPYGLGTPRSLRPVLYHQGVLTGKSLVGTMQDVMKMGNVEKTVSSALGFLAFLAFFRGYGFFELVSETENEIIVRLHNSFEVDSYKRNFDKPATQPVCHFTRGMLGEVFSELNGKPVKVEETTCAAMGGTYCEFKITMKGK